MSTETSHMASTDVSSFVSHLQNSKRIVALLGAGLSASSGLPTFRGAGGYWRTHDATVLATPDAFRIDPGLVWQFYSYRRHMALNAKPNKAHLALAELARRNPEFITLSQNVDGLSPRAGHPAGQLKLLHGSLFDIKCWEEHNCGYFKHNDFTDPIVPALTIPEDHGAARDFLGKAKKEAVVDTPKHALIRGADIAHISVPIPAIPKEELPQCPSCKKNLLRPGVVWFGESLPDDVLGDVDKYFNEPKRIDLMLVIGTSSKVFPAAAYSEIARTKGARVAVINMDQSDAKNLGVRDWFFGGDAAVIVPDILKSVVGEIGEFTD
jgi:NAD+-dependent protein deacetylase sirtuin 5